MSTVSINFLRQRHKQLSILQKADRRYATILAYITAGVVLVSVILIGLQLFLSASLNNVKKKESAVTSQISSLSSVEQEYLTLAQKFDEIKTFLKGKFVQQEAVEYFSSLFASQQVTLVEVNREKEGLINFKVSASNVFQLQQLMSFMQTKEVLTKYPTLAVSDLSREKTGVYSTNVSVILPLASPTPAPKKTIKPLNL
ncbi:MAG: hypothetical protein ABI425_04845 [Patescibacteria group bacterium]